MELRGAYSKSTVGGKQENKCACAEARHILGAREGPRLTANSAPGMFMSHGGGCCVWMTLYCCDISHFSMSRKDLREWTKHHCRTVPQQPFKSYQVINCY